VQIDESSSKLANQSFIPAEISSDQVNSTLFRKTEDQHFNIIKVGSRKILPKKIDAAKIGFKKKQLTANSLRRTEQPFLSTFDAKAKKTTDKSERHLKSESHENLSVGPFHEAKAVKEPSKQTDSSKEHIRQRRYKPGRK
jgi:hypothetical protein